MNQDAISAGFSMPQKAKRIHFMDELRGFAVICMVFYHGFYTVAYLFNQAWGMDLLKFFMPAEPFFAALFIFISGISSDLSRSNLKRGLKLFIIAALVTIVTVFAVPQEAIWFGILHFLSVCMILFGLTKSFFSKIPCGWGIAGCVLLFLFTKDIHLGYLGLSGEFAIDLPPVLYTTNWLAPLGICSNTFASADYFPLLPWIFIFLSGTFLGRYAAAEKFPEFMYQSHIPFFSFAGKHALVIYIAHQPIIYGIALFVQAILSWIS